MGELTEEDSQTLHEAITVLDYLFGDTDGDGQDCCPSHGPPAFRAIRALVELTTGKHDALECTCGVIGGLDEAERIARAFHEAYERLAPEHGYETRKESAVPWEQVPKRNRKLMVSVVTKLLHAGVIRAGNSQSQGGTR